MLFNYNSLNTNITYNKNSKKEKPYEIYIHSISGITINYIYSAPTDEILLLPNA